MGLMASHNCSLWVLCGRFFYKGRGDLMSGNDRSKMNPVFRLRINDANVVIRFSETESSGVKDRVREILTEAYEERFEMNLPVGAASV